MGPIGIPELVLIFIILLLIFGGKKIPELARGLGAGIRNFKDALHGGEQGDQKNGDQKSKETKNNGAPRFAPSSSPGGGGRAAAPSPRPAMSSLPPLTTPSPQIK